MRKLGFILLLSCLNICYADDNQRIQETCSKNRCQAIIDAGSSGSRMYIYASPYHLDQWKVIWNKKVEPGLSTIPSQTINAYLNKLVQVKDLKPMSLSLYGTAGMRLLTQTEQDERYQMVKNWILNHPEWRLNSVRTITGQEEGVFAWLAVQSELNLLKETTTKMKSVVEFGGASAQVSIPLQSSEIKKYNQADIYPVKLSHKILYVWSKSYLGLGINEVEKNFIDTNSCYSMGYPLKNGSLGQGDISQCIQALEAKPELALMHRLIDSKQVITAHPNLNWVALGAVRFSALTPPYRFPQNQFSLMQMREQGDSLFCHESWGVLGSKYLNDPYLYRQCFSASYFYSSLIDGMGINEQQNFYYPDAHAQMDWTLGALLATDAV